MTETFPEMVARIKAEQNVSTMTARRIAAASFRLERAVRERRTKEIAKSMREASV